MGKILIASGLFPPEPVVSARLSLDIAQSLASAGNDVTVISPRPSRPLNYHFPIIEQEYNFKHVILDSYTCPASSFVGRFRESYSFGRALKKYIKRNHHQFDVIYANVWPLFSQWLLAKVANRYRIPYCIHVQDVYPESYSEKISSVFGWIIKILFLPMDRYILLHAAKVIAISHSEAEYLSSSRGISIDNISVVRNWQEDDNFVNSYQPISLIPHKLRFMYLGNINPTSNVEFIINTFSKIAPSTYELSIIGNGSNKKRCEKLVIELGLDVEFGEVAPEFVPKKQSEADILILSLREGVAKTATPSKLTAYLYSGRPILASVDVDSDCSEIILNGRCGIVVPSNKDDELRKAILKFVSLSTDELNKMGLSGMDFAKQELSKDANLEKILNIILSLLQRRNK